MSAVHDTGSTTVSGTGSTTVPGLGLIWAQANGAVIGRDNLIPWHVPEDMAHFRATTSGSTVIMGRRTWDSLPERFRPLPGRRNIVVSRDHDWAADGALGVTSVPEAIELSGAAADTPVWVMGGGEIYSLALPHASVLEITELDLDIDGDTVAPAIDPAKWTASAGEWQTSAAGIRHRFVRYHRAAHDHANPEVHA